MNRALVFDLDGTLVDSLPDLHAALNQMLRGLGRRELSPDDVRRMIGDGTQALVGRALCATAGPETTADVDGEAAHQHFLNFYQSAPTRWSRLYPNVAETLDSLAKSGAKLGICTNKQQEATLAVLEGFGIAKHFSAIVGGDAVPFRKPDPRHLLAVIEQLEARPNETVMIGDNENDYAAGRGVGAAVVLMRYGYLRVPPQTLAPDAWLDRFCDLPGTIAKFSFGRLQR